MTDAELNAHFKVIKDRLFDIEKAQDGFKDDLDKDRGDLYDFTVEVARLGAIVDSMRKSHIHQSEKIADKVEEVVQPIIDSTDELKEAIKTKKVITLKPGNWFSRLRGR